MCLRKRKEGKSEKGYSVAEAERRNTADLGRVFFWMRLGVVTEDPRPLD